MFILDVDDSAFLVAQPPVHLDEAIEIVGKWIDTSTYIIYFLNYFFKLFKSSVHIRLYVVRF